MKALNIAICEDDSAEFDKLSAILDTCGFDLVTEHFTDGSGLVSGYYTGKYDLLLVDIYMNGLNGIDTVAKIRQMDGDVPIAFITTSLDHALDGYRYHVDRYITKPLNPEEITDILRKALFRKESQPVLPITFANKTINIPLGQIRYLESIIDTVHIYLSGGGIEKTRAKLKDIAPLLPQPPFYVCHKSFIVNLSFVAGYDKAQCLFEMKEGGKAYVKRECKTEADRILRQYMFDLARKQSNS
ncbi:MAG: LytTR family DNA-binding domain-containing protein [Lachnospiraceae bacterium]|nr:LytTR family DNA-binding domain-containing protein [Lachnospiraceae bacterium]